MKPSIRACLYLLILTLTHVCNAAPESEPGIPDLVPPTDPLDAYYTALGDLERSVDSYFHAALRQRVAVTAEKLRELDTTLKAQAEQAVGEETGRLLTAREMIVRAKLAMLGELDERFSGETMPDDVLQRLASVETKRRAAIDLLIEGGAL